MHGNIEVPYLGQFSPAVETDAAHRGMKHRVIQIVPQLGPATTTIGFLHTSPVHVSTFDALTHQSWPLLGTIHVVNESILTQARAEGPEVTRSAIPAHLNERS